MPLADWQQRADILQSLKETGGKYAKPFEKGKLKSTSFLGGSWNEYAQIVLAMVMADTMLEIEAELKDIRAHLTK